jgi:hypothetical protein
VPLDPPSTLGREFLRKYADTPENGKYYCGAQRDSTGAAFAPITAFNEVVSAIVGQAPISGRKVSWRHGSVSL